MIELGPSHLRPTYRSTSPPKPPALPHPRASSESRLPPRLKTGHVRPDDAGCHPIQLPHLSKAWMEEPCFARFPTPQMAEAIIKTRPTSRDGSWVPSYSASPIRSSTFGDLRARACRSLGGAGRPIRPTKAGSGGPAGPDRPSGPAELPRSLQSLSSENAGLKAQVRNRRITLDERRFCRTARLPPPAAVTTLRRRTRRARAALGGLADAREGVTKMLSVVMARLRARREISGTQNG